MTTGPTLADLSSLLGTLGGGFLLDYHYAKNADARTRALEGIMDDCYVTLVAQRAHNQEHSEDALTDQIVGRLKGYAINATHDQQIGGHCDITVEAGNGYLWIAEAKIHRQYKWLVDGFNQLSTRYAVAMPGRKNGEIIIYCRTKNAKRIMTKWKKVFSENFPDARIVSDDIASMLSFVSEHPCQSSGLEFETRHKILPMNFSPKK